jgi:hypothetical protein
MMPECCVYEFQGLWHSAYKSRHLKRDCKAVYPFRCGYLVPLPYGSCFCSMVVHAHYQVRLLTGCFELQGVTLSASDKRRCLVAHHNHTSSRLRDASQNRALQGQAQRAEHRSSARPAKACVLMWRASVLYLGHQHSSTPKAPLLKDCDPGSRSS